MYKNEDEMEKTLNSVLLFAICVYCVKQISSQILYAQRVSKYQFDN